MQISFKSVHIFVKTWQAQLRNCQNRNSHHTSNNVCLLSVCLINNRHLANHISEQCAKFCGKCNFVYVMVIKPAEIDTETEICTSLKSEFYFWFRWTPSTKSTLIRYISVWIFVTIRGKICPPQSRNWKNGFCTSLKSVNYFRFVPETIAFETTTFLSGVENLVKIGKELRK